jgi:hypothetical protein
MMVREHGWRAALVMMGFIFPFAFFCGFVAKHLLLWLHHFGWLAG